MHCTAPDLSLPTEWNCGLHYHKATICQSSFCIAPTFSAIPELALSALADLRHHCLSLPHDVWHHLGLGVSKIDRENWGCHVSCTADTTLNTVPAIGRVIGFISWLVLFCNAFQNRFDRALISGLIRSAAHMLPLFIASGQRILPRISV